jgi:CTP synthase (UTP-ammonia lyase)
MEKRRSDYIGELITIIFHIVMALRYEIKSVQAAQKPLPDCDERAMSLT